MNDENKAKKSILKKWWFWVLVVIIIAGIGSSGSNNSSQPLSTTTQATLSETENQSGATTATGADSSKITMEEFQNVKNGMTYDEAVAIIGGNGELSSEIGVEGEPYYTVTYTFEGDKFASNAILTFMDGKLSSKVQYGLD